MRDHLPNRELRGPRQITSSNIDRIFDDSGQRFLMIEEKAPGEAVSAGQMRLLRALAALPQVTVWGVRGTPDNLTITDIQPGSTNTFVESADFGTYQQQVDQWFRCDSDVIPWGKLLEALKGMPWTAPSWCPAEDWDALDKALAAVLRHQNRKAAA
jgi:hypothetical protein